MKRRSQMKGQFNFWLLNLHKEIMKTSAIGKKMLTASRTNTHMRESYEDLGRLLERAVENGEVDWDSPKMRALIHNIKACKKDLKEIEQTINVIKFTSIEYKNSQDQDKN